MKLEIGTTVKHSNFGVGKVVNYLPGDNVYLIYFPLQHDLHNGRHPYEGLPGYDTNQYWWCQPTHIEVISEEEYNREKEVNNMNTILEIGTKVRHESFGVGKVMNYVPADKIYLVYFPLCNDLHNGSLPQRGIEGRDTTQYWWGEGRHLTVISEEEYEKEKEVRNMNIEELMNTFKVGDTIKYVGTGTDGNSIPYQIRGAQLLKVMEYDTDSNKVSLQILCEGNGHSILGYASELGGTRQLDIEELKHFTHHEIKCSNCGESITTVVVDRDNNVWCQECLDNAIDNEEMIQCDYCGEYVRWDDARYIESSDRTVCYDCYDENYRTCECCGNTYHIDSMYYHERSDYWYCECCYPGDSEFEPVYNPMVSLEKGKRYFGMELEVENYDNYSYGITDQIMDIMGNDTILEIKEDGSLDNGGFEIVFQPLSEEYINSDEFKDKLTKLSNLLQRNNFYKEAPNGGIHIHTTRLGGEDIADLYTLAKFFDNELKQINARFYSSWCRIGDYTTDYGKNKELNDAIQGETRYQWWNTTNRSTIECRAFDSSLDVDTILNDYNFVINAFKYRCDKKVNNVTWDMLMGKSTNITKTSKVYSVDTLRYIKKMYKTNNGKLRAIKHIMSIMDKELRVQLDALNYDKVVSISNELRNLKNIMSNSFLLKDYSLEYIATLSRALNIEELNEYVRHL